MPSERIASAAPAANFITSPCVTFATVGMFLPTRGSFKTVLATFDTNMSFPKPFMWMSNLSSNLPNSKQLMNSCSSSGVSTSALNGRPFCSQWDTAKRVNDRKTLPLDQHTARGRAASNFATVVPLPVPLNPCSTSTQPLLGASPKRSIIFAATASADMPMTSILQIGSTLGSAGITPFATAICIPAANLSSSSWSRCKMPSVSFFEKSWKTASDLKAAMTAFEVESSAACSRDLLRAGTAAEALLSTRAMMESSSRNAARTASADGLVRPCSCLNAGPIMR
mmetsp:Transcript_51151/g.95885  ORF Transcript_51151/g.95885 Transcript_51151/m.95885 type:complete len:282 (+) Transcript_51151:418-1263(+)